MITYSRGILKFVLVLGLATITNSQSGGQFTISPSVIASGGGTSSAGQFTVQGTAGQSSAGASMASPPFTQTGGFWQPLTLAPTAANVSISGRVTTQNGRGLAQVLLVLTDSKGNVRQDVASTFGYYRFNDVEAGAAYILTVLHKRYQFTDSPRMIVVKDELTGVDFVASPLPSKL